VEKSLQDDERARKRQSEAAEATETQARVRELEDERDRIVAVLSGAPGMSVPAATVDRAALRVRLNELNSELKELSSPSDVAEPASEGVPDARSEGRDT
jgi:hypothetical protein